MSKRFARRLKRLRKQAGLTQEALARKARFSLPYIGRLELGQHDPSLSTVQRLAKALEVEAADLMSEQSRRLGPESIQEIARSIMNDPKVIANLVHQLQQGKAPTEIVRFLKGHARDSFPTEGREWARKILSRAGIPWD